MHKLCFSRCFIFLAEGYEKEAFELTLPAKLSKGGGEIL